MRLFPYFFSQRPKGRKARDVDVSGLAETLRTVAFKTELRFMDPKADVFSFKSMPVLIKGNPAQLLFDYVATHWESLAPELEKDPLRRNEKQGLMSSWCGIATATSMFVNSVAGLSNGGEPIGSALQRRVLLILKRDIDNTEATMRTAPGLDRDFWFWKAFIAAMSLALRLRESGVDDVSFRDSPSYADDESPLLPLQLYYEGCVHKWSSVAQIYRWKDAKAALTRIAWPECSPNQAVAEALWERVIQAKRFPTSSTMPYR